MPNYPSPTLQNLTVNGSADLITATISGGSVDGTTVGATTPASVKATTLQTTGAATLASVTSASATLTGGSIDGMVIGGTTPADATVSNLTASGTISGAGATALLAPYETSAHASSTYAALSNLAGNAAGQGADLVGFLQAGTGATGRVSQDKIREIQVSVTDFGADPTGVADSTTAFNEAVTLVGSLGGGVIYVPQGTFKVTSTITVSSNEVVFIGAGFDTMHDTGSTAHATTVLYAGPATDTVFLFTSIAGASNKCLTGCGLIDIAVNGGGIADKCVRLMSHRQGRWRFYGTGSTGYILYIGCVSTLGEAADSQSNMFELWGRQFSSGGSGVCLAADNANTGSANTSFNQFKFIDLQINTGTGITFGNSDTNFFGIVRVTGVTTGKAYEFLGSNISTSGVARGNFIRWMSSSGPGYARGTTSFTYPSISNYIGLDIGNATPYPTIETGATCYYSAAGVIPFNPSGAQMNLAGNVPDAINDKANISGETLRLYSSSSKHLYLTDGTNTWGVYITGGNLRIKLIAGSGTFGFGSFTSSADAAVNGYITIQDANGNTRKLATIA